MTLKQQKDIETVEYFIPEVLKHIPITQQDKEMFLEYSERGLHKDKVKGSVFVKEYDGFNALIEGKRWRGIHIHELYEKGVLDGSMPYYVILGGYNPKEERMPRPVVDFLKKEMFQGIDANAIEKCYNEICMV